MTLEEQIRILCVRYGISVAELARRYGTSPQNFNSKLKRGSFKIAELEQIAEVLGCDFEHYFVLNDGERI
ncbi:helix-turn-helix domain-containing protein [Hornefia butyriciproducens]|jgi:transcriptional regulator with XRE-family HTH domain|uniref:helix-turn-helix domain-containing protein n=1 Tax=Clostridia TaxID=186801 RepID=UPI000B7E76D5|nr:helix-turn-helix transcriptional regulator [Eubacterium pyruvativorans]